MLLVIDTLPSLASVDPADLLVAIGMTPSEARAVLYVVCAVLVVQLAVSFVGAAGLAAGRPLGPLISRLWRREPPG